MYLEAAMSVPGISNHYGMLLHVAAALGAVPDIVRLISAGEDVNAFDDQGRTPLNVAEAYGRETAAEIIRRHGGF